MRIAKKYFLFQGVDRKKAELKRVRIAKKIHSSLLPTILCNHSVTGGYGL